jgi:hypothetical protein
LRRKGVEYLFFAGEKKISPLMAILCTFFIFSDRRFLFVTGGHNSAGQQDQSELMTFDPLNNPLPGTGFTNICQMFLPKPPGFDSRPDL